MKALQEIQCHERVLTLISDKTMFKHTDADHNTIMMRNRHLRSAVYNDDEFSYHIKYSDKETEEDFISIVETTVKMTLDATKS